MKTCPYCAEQIQDAAIKCRFCGTSLIAQSDLSPTNVGSADPVNDAPARSRLSLVEQELIYQRLEKKSLVGAILLNILWAGAGNLYVGRASGGLFVLFAFFSWLLTIAWIGFGAATFGLFLWSSTICSKVIQMQNAELRSRIAHGEFDSGLK